MKVPNINAKDLAAFRTSRGLKLGTIPKKMSFDNQELAPETMKLRGKTSLKFRRKSYRVELSSPFTFKTTQGQKALKDFHLLSLTMDRGYFGNRLAFACLRETGVADLYHSFLELKINGQSEGLYCFIQRPEDYIWSNIQHDWKPLHDSPSFPSYPSGHSAFGAAVAEVLTHQLGEDFALTDRTHDKRKEFAGKPRSYSSFREMALENAASRIYLGVHFRMDCEEGVRLGLLCGRKVNDLPWLK